MLTGNLGRRRRPRQPPPIPVRRLRQQRRPVVHPLLPRPLVPRHTALAARNLHRASLPRGLRHRLQLNQQAHPGRRLRRHHNRIHCIDLLRAHPELGDAVLPLLLPEPAAMDRPRQRVLHARCHCQRGSRPRHNQRWHSHILHPVPGDWVRRRDSGLVRVHVAGRVSLPVQGRRRDGPRRLLHHGPARGDDVCAHRPLTVAAQRH